MARPVFELRQYEELCAAFLPGMIVRVYRCHIVHSYISRTALPRQHQEKATTRMELRVPLIVFHVPRIAPTRIVKGFFIGEAL
jgi:hypothetical protein